ncbi:MAG TPA: FAD-dependent thymidylate synthase [Dehalococcoidia bacterium]|nr:FAD-dependent thymidylate synthase [Dehalococcoidia bacterium]
MESTPERKPPNRGIEVKLLDHTSDPVRSLYMAYRVAYSALTPIQIAARIEDERITREQMMDFILKRLETGHASPLEQIWFEFGIAGVTRAFSHQFVRHHMGISFEQQSQRYVTFKGGEFPYTVPETVKRLGLAEEYQAEFDRLAELYDKLIQAGVPAEDARFVLPTATNTNFKITVNFLEFLHIADLRLCTRAQWEFRKVVALMRAEVMRRFPELARYLQPKCGEHRLGYCDESLDDWRNCPLGGRGGKRPHKSVIFETYRRETEKRGRPPKRGSTKAEDASQTLFLFDTTSLVVRKREITDEDFIPLEPLNEEDFLLIEREESST